MRDLICGYCGAKVLIREYTAAAYTECTNPKCDASGPTRPTPELAAAAHATVTPAVRWGSEPPKAEGFYWFRNLRLGFKDPYVVQHERDDKYGPERDDYSSEGDEYAGPIPLPLEPGEPQP